MGIFEQWWLVLLAAASPVVPGTLQIQVPTGDQGVQDVATVDPAPFPVKQAGAIEPVIVAKSALLIDVPSQAVLFEKDSDKTLPIASLSKLVTAIIVTERTKPDDLVAVPAVTADPEESRMGLRPGEQLRSEDLLAGLLIASANDAATALAVKVSGSEQAFVDLMNDHVQRLGLRQTRFENPSGYGKGENVSSAKDLAVISRIAMAEPRIRQLVPVKELTVKSVNGTEYALQTTDQLLGSYLPIAGLKTGTSDAAGPCLISLVSTPDRQVLAIVLDSPSRFQENKAMLDWSLRSFRW